MSQSRSDTLREEMLNFFRLGEKVSYDTEEVILDFKTAPSDPRYMYHIVEGFVRVDSYCGGMQSSPIVEQDCGGMFPVYLIAHDKTLPVCFVAMSPVVCYRQPVAEFKKFIKSNPESFGWAMYDQLTAAYERAYNLSINQTDIRLAHRLMMLGKRYGRKVDDQIWITMPIKQQFLAGSIHASRETVGRILQDFENRDLLVYGRRTIIIWPQRLAKLIEEASNGQ